MKHQIQLFFLLLFALTTSACSGEKEEAETSIPLLEQNFEFEIYDSLVVDHIGIMQLMDISPDGEKFILIELNTDEIFITDPKGEILYRYIRNQDGPDSYRNDRTGVAQFISNDEFVLPTTWEIAHYKVNGDLIKKFEPEHRGFSSLVDYTSHSLFLQGNYFYTKTTGRYAHLGQYGIEYQTESKQLEKVNSKTGEYEPIIPFPKSSKFSSKDYVFGGSDFHPSFTAKDDSMFVMFRNEPKLFVYSLSDLDSPVYTKRIPLKPFVERNTNVETKGGGFSTRDQLLGSINSIYKMDNSNFLINYSSGVTNEQYENAKSSIGGDENQIYREARKFNKTGTVIFDGKSVSAIIKESELLWNIAKVVSNDEIWFNLDFSKVENDYSVIYKTRLVEK